MFSEFEHDPPDSDDIMLFAGPKERQALAKALGPYMYSGRIEPFISELQKAVLEQTFNTESINDYLGRKHFHKGDACVHIKRHLSNMSEEDVDKVMRHLHALFIDRCGCTTGVNTLDNYLYAGERKDIFYNIIVPWLDWVRSVRKTQPAVAVADKSSDQIKSTTTVTDKEPNNTIKDKEPNSTTKDNTTNKKPSTNRRHFMFSKFKHDPTDCDDIVLCAGPKERRALITVLEQETEISDAETFIVELDSALLDQTCDIESINEELGREYFHKDDEDVYLYQHLSGMSQEDAHKVLKHLHALFIGRTEYNTEVEALENCLSDEERKTIFNTIIVPWLDWVRSAKKNKSTTSKANTNKKSNTTPNNKPSNNNNTNMSNNTTTTANMFESLTSIFANMLGTLEPNMIRMTFDGKVAVKTTKGYKTYDVAKKKAINMDSLVMPEMASFLLLPSTKVKVGDIILRDGAFYSIISVDDATNELIGYNYEAGKKETIVRETHCFLGNTYFYSKLFSPILSFFGNKPKSDKKEEESKDDDASEDTMSALLPLAMMSQNGDMSSLLPLMFMSKMEGKENSSSMMKMLMLGGMMGGGNSNMNNLLPLMMMSGNFPAI